MYICNKLSPKIPKHPIIQVGLKPQILPPIHPDNVHVPRRDSMRHHVPIRKKQHLLNLRLQETPSTKLNPPISRNNGPTGLSAFLHSVEHGSEQRVADIPRRGDHNYCDIFGVVPEEKVLEECHSWVLDCVCGHNWGGGGNGCQCG